MYSPFDVVTIASSNGEVQSYLQLFEIKNRFNLVGYNLGHVHPSHHHHKP